MKIALRRLLFFLAMVPAAFAASGQNCGCSCCTGKPVCCCNAGSDSAEAKRYPVRGVITAIYAERSALMVKHEEIPGLMRPMTMLFKVDAATLKAAKKGQTITAQLSRQGDEWWLHDVKPAGKKNT